MEMPSPWTGPTVLPAPDARVRDLVIDYGGMDEVVAGLVLPTGAPMAVLSALETARELVRHSYYRYEFATVGVLQSLVALEIVLDGRAAELPAELVERIDRVRLLRDKVSRVAAARHTPSAGATYDDA
ncbi:hypothetical protein [Yinghuangia soli]|uniref:Uncharacterized protein n=1 Tax=Yinghuangia soli TaxID=2908204 RepID=A0AA41PX88_9ACTN|nr:hypothetical protein [Yinghuangia soli]MCF2527030.1 hypothetical protein [Yinghuangia soli]